MKRPEQEIQRSIVQYLELALRPGVRFWHTPNGGARSAVEAAILKGLGVKAGVPDLVLAWSERRRFVDEPPVSRVAFIEVKADKGALTAEQRDFRDWCLDNAVPWVVVRSLDDAIQVVKGWGLTKETR